MPHDRNGAALAVGDAVTLPAREIRYMKVAENPDHPEEYGPEIRLETGAEEDLHGKVTEIFEDEDACNAVIEVESCPNTVTLNSRLLVKREYAGVE